ncbi:Cell death protease [Entomortierella beljakovae]|nr:Cell death protease [Entomortierella beljakovae]
MRLISLTCLAASVVSQLLFLTHVQAQVADDYLVTNLPDLQAEDAAQLTQHAGHIAVDEAKESHLFFWMAANSQPQSSKKLIIWLNGGPGCSSADGFFLESGPLRFVDKKLTINKGGWHQFATVVFLDQPVGTGLSYTSKQLLGYLPDITKEFTAFLKAFFAIFPNLADYDLYLTGESYAGTYIPYFAKGILDHNEHLPEGHIPYNLKGVAIGNGWIDPLTQYTAIIPYVSKHKIDTPDMITKLTAQQDICLDDIRRVNRISQYSCERLVQIVLDASSIGAETQCLNQYDIRYKDEYPYCGLLWPYELPLMKTYLSNDAVRDALHASGAVGEWTECNTHVSAALRYDDSAPAFALLPDILKKIDVMLYSGDQDLICNHIGTEYLISNLTWQDVKGFQTAPQIPWTVEDKPAGVWRTERNLSYVLLYNASHMAPYDVPLVALDMINRFMGLDTTKQLFSSQLGSETLPPGGGKVDIDQPQAPSKFSITGPLIAFVLLLGIGAATFVIVRNNRRQNRRGRNHDGIQWFPLDTNRSSHTDELDELVVESGLQGEDDNEGYHDDDTPYDSPDHEFDSSRGRH